MSKELPYFKFFPSEWLSGDITLQPMDVQGVFINVCSIYWSKECRVAIAGLSQRYGEAIATLLESSIIKEKKGFAVINFLDEQWEELYGRHQKNVENGIKGNEKRWGKNREAIATLSHIDKIREDNIRKEKIIKDKNPFEKILFSDMKSFFLSEYQKKVNSPYVWGAKDAVHLNQIITKIKFKIKEKEKNTGAKEKERYEDDILKGFEHLLSSSKDKWINSQFSIPIFNSKFNEIFTQILTNNGKQSINASSIANAMEKEFGTKQSGSTV